MKRRGPDEKIIGMVSGNDLEIGLLGKPEAFDEGVEISELVSKGVHSLVREHEERLMNLTRENQSDNPRAPKRPFLRRLAGDIDQNLIDEGLSEQYEVRIYSAVNTALDQAGVDFWIELYDGDLGKTISTYKVDIKSNLEGYKGALADVPYYVDFEVASSSDPKAIYQQPEYDNLVKGAAERFQSDLEAIEIATASRQKSIAMIQYTHEHGALR